MQRFYKLLSRNILLLAGLILFSVQIGRAQAVYVPYSYQYNQKFNADIYGADTLFHTSLKPFLLNNTLIDKYNTLMNTGVDTTRKAWIVRKIFNEHVFDIKTKEYTFYADYLPDLQIGRDLPNKTTTYLNTRGYQLGGTVGDKFFFYSSGYENQGRFPAYFDDYVKSIGFVPGQAYDRDPTNSRSNDWSYVTAILSYTPIKQLNITLGEDKTFIGDGYRSLLLSDNAAPYPLLRLTANLGPIQYMVMITNMQDRNLPQFDPFGNNRRKWAGFHYLDWNVTNGLSIGYFNAFIAADANDQGQSHGFDVNYINPVEFISSLGPSTPYKDHVLNGFTGRYKIFDKTAIYGQFLLDRAADNTGELKNAYGWQAGLRGADLFGVTNFNYLFEYNTVKPDAYQGQYPILDYSHYSQPLGDPLGNNFREAIGILSYSIDRFDLQGQVNYATLYGYGSSTTQNTKVNMYYGEGTISYLINPKYNLRFEAGLSYFQEKDTPGGLPKTTQIIFGLRSTFRSLYHDF